MFVSSTQSGATPLFAASQNNHIDVVKLLLTAGANPDLAREVRDCISAVAAWLIIQNGGSW